MKKEEREVREYHIEEFTENGKAVGDAIMTALYQNDVELDDVMPVLAEGLTRVLFALSKVFDCDPVEFVHGFGEAIATCNIEIKKGKEG